MTTVRPLYLPPVFQDAIDHGRLILRDGSTATVRTAQVSDMDALKRFFADLSPESRMRRFFSAAAPETRIIRTFCDSSNRRSQLTLVVTRVIEGKPRIIAAASYMACDEQSAEVAFAVDDAFQGYGLGTLLLERLSVIAAMNGFVRFRAVTRADNRAMLDVFSHSGFPQSTALEDGYIEVDLSVVPRRESVERSEMRDRVFTAASLRPFFKPNAVAVVGASRDPASIGYKILEGLVMNRFQGPVYAVNPKAHVVCSMRAFRSVRELPEPVDLAILAVPRDAVCAAVDDCGARGVKALVVITAGFAEVDEGGRRLQAEVLEKARGYGMRMVGPNCLGLINTEPAVRLDASFSPIFPPHGRVAMSSQSGALGLALLAQARDLQLGVSTFVSVGNKADVTGNDLLQYWEEDPATDVILLYLESFGNPRRFARIARRVSRSKPIVCVKGGRTSAGSRAAGSHTAALAASDTAVEALFHQTGVIRAETLGEMFDLAMALATQPLPQGRRVGVLTNAGGPGILATDACEAGGLQVPEFSAATQARLRSFLPTAASAANPVDMIASANADQYRQAAETVLCSGEIDALIVIHIPVTAADGPRMREAVGTGILAARAAGGKDRPVLYCSMAADNARAPLRFGTECAPSYEFPESAASVLSRVVRYAEWRRTPVGVIPDFDDAQPEVARGICREALTARGGGWLSVDETRRVLTAYGLPLPPGGVAHTPIEAAEIARGIGFPVAVKLASHTLVHKTELGGVHLNLPDADSVRHAFCDIRDRLERDGKLPEMEGVLVQPMLKGGVEVMVGVTEDPLFGPLLAFGLGGIYVEILRDVCFRVTPLTDQDAAEMVRAIRGYRLLEGYRGHSPADVPAVEEALLRVSLLVEEVPEIAELDLNPIFALPPGKGCRIADARIRVAVPGSGKPGRAVPASPAAGGGGS